MHLETETIERFLHGELTPSDRSRVLRHAEACQDCRGRLDEAASLDEDVFGLIAGLQTPVPEVSAEDVRARARGRGRPTWPRWAAAVVMITVGAGAAYAAPGSPLPGWLQGAPGEEQRAVQPETAEPVPRAEPDGSGIVVEASRAWTIHLPETARALVVTLEGGAGVSVRSSDTSVTFDSDIDQISVGGTSSPAAFRVNVPPEALEVDIRVGGETVWRQSGGLVTTGMERATDGSYRVGFSTSNQGDGH